MGEPVEMQELIDECNRIQRRLSAYQTAMDDCLADMETRLNLMQVERNELIEMLREILRENYIPNSRRKAAYDLVVRLGGYQGKTEGQDDEN